MGVWAWAKVGGDTPVGAWSLARLGRDLMGRGLGLGRDLEGRGLWRGGV